MTTTNYSRAWGVLSFLFLINLLNFVDRTIPAVVMEPIRKEFMLSDSQLGLLGTVFTLVYAFAGLPLGLLADRWYRKYVLVGGVAVWSAFTAMSGMVSNFSSFLWVRLGVGVGEASCAPAAVSMIADIFPTTKRGRAMGIFMLGLPIGILTSFLVIGKIAAMTGSWRAPFIAAALPGFVLAILVMFIREPVRGAQESYATAVDQIIANPFRKVLAIRTIWWISFSGVALNMATYGTIFFFKAMLERYYLQDSLTADKISAVVLGFAGVIAMTGGAYFADVAQKRSPNGRLKLGVYCLLIASALVLLALLQPPGSDMVLFTLLYGTGWLLFYMYYASVYTAVQDVVEPRLRATAMSIYFAAQYLLGAAFGSLVVGGLSDIYTRKAMLEANATVLNDVFRGIGLHTAMFSVPVMLFVTGVMMWMASRTYLVDVEKVKLRSST